MGEAEQQTPLGTVFLSHQSAAYIPFPLQITVFTYLVFELAAGTHTCLTLVNSGESSLYGTQPLVRGHRFTDTEITWNHMGLASPLSAGNTPVPSMFLYLKAWLQEGKPGSSSPSVERNTAGDCYNGINSQAHASWKKRAKKALLFDSLSWWKKGSGVFAPPTTRAGSSPSRNCVL